jgi:hypothetical protein
MMTRFTGKLTGKPVGRGAATAAAAALAAVGMLVPAQAEATTLSSTVSAGDAGSVVSWQVPALPRTVVSVANTQRASEASTVLTLHNHRAPTTYRFGVTLPRGASLQLQPDGSIVVSRNGGPIGSFQTPWAKDATGRALATHYVLSGRFIEQQIDTSGARFPVTADPRYTTGWVTSTLYFNKSETRTIASAPTAASFACAAAGAVGGPPVVVACGVGAAQMYIQARTAVSRGQCIKLKFSLIPTPVYIGTYIYSGGYCT